MENDAIGYEMAEKRPRFEAIRDRHKNGTAPKAISVHQLFQTPVPLAVALVKLLAPPPGARILEPSAGLGRLLDALPLTDRSVGRVAIEHAPECAAELYRRNYIALQILQRDFLAVSPEETGLFDCVIMNPPFTMRSDIRHIEHALKFLKPGGSLAALCMNTKHRAEALKDRACYWKELPQGVFKSEGTNISAVMLKITD